MVRAGQVTQRLTSVGKVTHVIEHVCPEARTLLDLPEEVYSYGGGQASDKVIQKNLRALEAQNS